MELTMLSWSLYLIDIVSSFGNVLMFIGVAGSLAFTVVLAVYIISYYSYNDNSRSELRDFNIIKTFVKILCMSPVILIIALFIPENKTMNTILAIETANYVANTPEAQEIKSSILKKIQSSLEEEE